jgi:hypothetical protein
MSIRKSIVLLSLLLFSLGQAFATIELNLQHSDQQGCEINLELTEMVLENVDFEGVVYQRIPQTGLTPFATIGQAELLAMTFSLEIPATADVLFDLSSQIIEINDVTLWPQQLEEFQMDKPEDWQLDSDYYATDQFLPQEMVQISDPAIMRDHRLIQVSVVPFQYNPAQRILRIHTDLLISFNFSGENPINQLTHLLPPSSSFDNLMSGNVINRDAWVEAQREGDSYGLDPILFIYNSAALSFDLNDLIDWKREKGHIVYTATQSDMSLTSSASVGQYIQDAFDDWDLPPVHVVLVGDPSSCSFGTVAASNGYGDHEYACVAGGDILGDLFVGRMSVGNSAQLEAVVFKQLQYERTPYIAIPGWFDSAFLVGDDSITGMSAVFISENIRYTMEEQGFGNVSTCYNYLGCTNEPYYIDQQFNNGILYFNYRGYLGMSGWDNGDTDDLNNGFRTPFVVTITCGSNNFTSGTGIAEHFYQVGEDDLPKGAVAAIGTATSGTHTRYNNVVDAGVFGGVLNNGLTAGGALFQGKYELWQAYESVSSGDVTSFSYWNNLMGDASLQLWTGEPEAILVAHESSLPANATTLPVTVTRSGVPLADARVCIYQNGGLQVRALTDANGEVFLPLEQQLTAGNATLTVSGENIYPYQGNVTVSSESVYLDISSLAFTDDNGDGIPNPAESFVVFVQLRNLGTSQTAYSINATLNSSDNRITVQQDYSTYPNATPGTSVLCSTPYEFTIGPDVPQDADFDIDLLLDISCDAGDFTGVIHLDMEQPRLELTTVAPDPYGNGLISQGENGDLLITVNNNGNIVTGTCSATLTSGDPYVTVIDGNASFNSIAVNGSGTNTTPFVIQPAFDSFSGQMIPFTLTLTNGDGMQLQQELEVEVDEMEVYDPQGPVGGYYCFDNGDEFYTNHPLYNWVEISSSGTVIPLTDNGDENDDSYTLSLPFNFNYFDQSYTQLTVCSNGWLAMGDQEDQVSYRNYPIPTSPGPDAMIAPFWDDLRVATSGTSQRVYYQYDAANHRYIVEWYQLLQVGSGTPIETFQVILYDQDYHDGDNGDILFQYQNVTNNMNSSGTDNHYATVGIENPTETDGIEYSYWNSYPAGARPLQSGLAILFTQRRGEYDTNDYSGPVINHVPSSFQSGQDPYPIQATISDMSNVAEASLFWSLNQSSWEEVTMSEQGGDLWRGYIPGHANGTVVYYYLHAVDGSAESNESTSSVYSFEVVDGGPPSGPDSYGYYISDWMDVDRVSYGWIDISGSGTPLNLSDDSGANVSLPFNFMFYGQSRTSIYVCSNGFAQFGDSDNTYSNQSLPQSTMGHMLVPFWRDLNPAAGGNVYYQSLPEQHIFVISWVNVPYYYDTGSNTFQIILYDQDYYGSVTGDGHVVFQYNSTNDFGSCTIGLQNGSTAVQYVYNNNYDSDALPLSNNTALHITTGTEAVSPVDDLTILLQGDNLFLDWTASAGAQSYNVYRSDNPYSGFSQLTETTNTSWLHTDGVDDGAGFYRVTANGGFRQELLLQYDPDSEQPREVPVLSRHSSSK